MRGMKCVLIALALLQLTAAKDELFVDKYGIAFDQLFPVEGITIDSQRPIRPQNITKSVIQLFHITKHLSTDQPMVEQLYDLIDFLDKLQTTPLLPGKDQEIDGDKREKAIKKLNTFCSSKMKGVEIVYIPSLDGYGIRAKYKIARGDRIFETSINDTINYPNALKTFKNTNLSSLRIANDLGETEPLISEGAMLALQLMFEQRNFKLKFKPFIEALPVKLELFPFYSHKNIRLLRHSTTYQSALVQLQEMLFEYAVLYRYIDTHRPPFKQLRITLDVFSLQYFLWARSIVETRSHRISYDTSETMAALIPCYDMINYAKQSSTSHIQISGTGNDGTTPDLKLWTEAAEDIHAGSQIYLNYDPSADMRTLFLQWGIVDDDGALNQTVEVFTKPTTLTVDNLEAKIELLQRLGLEAKRSLRFRILLTDSGQEEIRLATHSDRQFLSILSTGRLWPGGQDAAAVDLEAKRHDFLLGMIETELSKFNVNLQKASELLRRFDELKHDGNRRQILQQICAEHRALHAAGEVCYQKTLGYKQTKQKKLMGQSNNNDHHVEGLDINVPGVVN